MDDSQPSQAGLEEDTTTSLANADSSPSINKKKNRKGADPSNQKRRCVSTACVACRRRKSKCDGAIPSCAACASVYGTECVYDPNSDHRRKGVYREKIDSMKARASTLQILIEAILNASEEEVPNVVKKIRTCDSLDAVAESILKQEIVDETVGDESIAGDDFATDMAIEGERDLARKMGELRLENGSVRFIGGTSHLIYLGDPNSISHEPDTDLCQSNEDPVTSWTNVTTDTQLVIHLINMYFSWHYTYFTTLSKRMFYQDFLKGRHSSSVYCSQLLVNAILALGCHFTSVPGAYATPGDSRTKGDHFFAEAKRLILENDEYEKPRLTTVQALALMSVREAGCGREAKGWVYSGMSFRMAQDIGLNLDDSSMGTGNDAMNEHEIDARRITFWGCFLFDKCWSNYMGRLPQIPGSSYNVPKFDVFPEEEAELWSPYTDSGNDPSFRQPARTRAIALQLSLLCEISSDLLTFFYHPSYVGKSSGKAAELKKLSELHRRLEEWRKDLPKEFEPKEGQLPNVILMHMFFHLQYIHLFRPFLKYTPAASPLPSHVSPRRICTANAGAISKLVRLYKKTWNLRQICNIAVYMIHSASTIHILNLPEKTARRDVIHGVRQLEEIAEDWLCARRTLSILSVLARKWKCDLPEEAATILAKTDEKYGTFNTADVPSPISGFTVSPSPPEFPATPPSMNPEQYSPSATFSQAQLAQDLNPADPHLRNASLVSPNGTDGRQQASQVAISIPLGSNGLVETSGWARTRVTQPLSSYRQPFTPTSLASAQTSRTGTRQVSPTSVFPGTAIDGQDWFLSDGVRWHQNFESWGLGPAGPINGTGAAASGPSRPLTDSVFMFRRGHVRSPSEEVSGLDGLSTNLNGSGWLPGLE